MTFDRRRLLNGILAAGMVPIVGCSKDPDHNVREDSSALHEEPGRTTMLILGGTGFVGPYVVRRALETGFDVTLFNRGRTSLDIFPDLELLTGDRNGELDSVSDEVRAGRRWDVVVDLSGFTAIAVRDAATLLSRATEHYVFISSVAAYRTFETANDESSDLHTVWRNDYGPQKAQAENEALIAMDGRVSNIRPSIIAGPDDPRDRLSYWPVRVSRGGDMLIPGPMDAPVQFVDVRDVAAFVIHCAEQRLAGSYNAVIPAGSYTMAQMIADCRQVTGGEISATWVTPEFIGDQAINAEAELPLWDSPLGSRRAFSMIAADRSFASGLTTRPPIETIRDTYQWWQTLPTARQGRLRAGLDPLKEGQLLSAWAGGSA